MRICISGPQGVGKSTLVKHLETLDYFKEFKFFNEPVRELIKNGIIKNPKEGDLNFYEEGAIFLTHIKNLHLSEPSFNAIYDRGVLDFLCYNIFNSIFKNKGYIDTFILFSSFVALYDVVFILEKDVGLVEDGIRNANREDFEKIRRIFLTMATVFPNTVIVRETSLQDRADFILRYVQSVQKGII